MICFPATMHYLHDFPFSNCVTSIKENEQMLPFSMVNYTKKNAPFISIDSLVNFATARAIIRIVAPRPPYKVRKKLNF